MIKTTDEINKLREVLNFDEQSGKFYWVKLPKNRQFLIGREAGGMQKSRGRNVYWIIRFNKKGYRRSNMVFAFINNRWPYPLIDHINGNSLDDTPSNLREADHLLNARNHLYKSIRITHSNRFQARLGQTSIGVFATKDQAEKAYDKARAELWGT